MKRWQRIRVLLRAVAVTVGPAAAALAPVYPRIAAVVGAVALLAGGLSTDLPRDRWTESEKKEFVEKQRRRRTTRANPLMLVLTWRTGPR